MKSGFHFVATVLLLSCLYVAHAFPSLMVRTDGGVTCGDWRLRLPATLAREDNRLQLGVSQHGRLVGARRRISTALGAAMKFRNFEEMLTAFPDTPVVVSFHATWCGPCRLMMKELAVVSDEFGDGIKMFAVDTEKWPKLGTRYEVAGLPTIVIFKGGEIRHRIEGMTKAEEVARRVKNLM